MADSMVTPTVDRWLIVNKVGMAKSDNAITEYCSEHDLLERPRDPMYSLNLVKEKLENQTVFLPEK